MRTLAVAAALTFAAPAAEAAPKHVGQAVITLAAAYGGGLAGGIIGIGAYSAYDPYQRNADDAEAFLIGGPTGFALGGWGGASIAHLVMGSPVGAKVWTYTGLMSLVGGGLVFVTPALYENFQDNRFATAWIIGLLTTTVAMPFTAFGAVMFGKKKEEAETSAFAPRRRALEVAVLPAVSHRQQGLTLSARF
ncbi:MAG: hypothetical protein EP330_20580 [Deltaproteobacteria bacterium]|nr:MAG: hypothetical protein EP330_20580 [Deltaproteobacteria bacterium]